MVLMVLCAWMAPARADEPAQKQARQAFTRGSQHFDLGEYADALADFKEAYRLVSDPVFLFNIAQCQRQLGDRQQAIRSYRMYLVKAPDAPNAESVRETVAQLQHELAAAPPPQPALLPAAEPAPPATTAAVLKATAPPPPRAIPVYKRPWLWATVGAVVIVGVALGVALPLALQPHTPTTSTDLGTVRF